MKRMDRLALMMALAILSGPAFASLPKSTRAKASTAASVSFSATRVIARASNSTRSTPVNSTSLSSSSVNSGKNSSSNSDADWTRWARAVGQSEENRDVVIAKLRSIKNLKAKLIEALPTKNRAMALDVMAALEMHDLVEDLLVYMSADEDGFVTLTISSLIDSKNQAAAIGAYGENLKPENLSRFSAPTIVAMLEPLGRIGTKLPNSTIEALSKHSSPDVRGATLYYLRMMALSNHEHSQDRFVQGFLKNSEFQLRLEAVSILAEFSRSRDSDFEPENIVDQDDLKIICKKESAPIVRKYCLSLAEKPKGDR